MTHRGDRLRAFASCCLDAGTMERVVDPAVADLQRGPLVAGYVGVLKVLAMCGAGALYDMQILPTDERRTFQTTIGISFLALLLLTAVLAAPPYFQYSSGAAVGHLGVTAATALLPQALTVSVPMALMLGIAFGVGGRSPSLRLRLVLALLALVCSIGSFVNLGWLTPAANQVFRVEMFRGVAPGPPAPEKNDSELTLGELRRAITQSGLASLRPGGHEWTSVNRRRLGYQTRWSFSFATFALVAPLLSFTVRRQRRLALVLAVTFGCFGYYTLLYFSRQSVLNGELPVVVGAWLPNAVWLLIAAAIFALNTRKQSGVEVRLKADTTY